MRESCVDCTRKHLSTAIPYMQEEELGYQGHGWLAVGELCHAELEIIRADASIASAIRSSRIQYMNYLNSKDRKLEDVPDIVPLIMMVTTFYEVSRLSEPNLFTDPEK